MIKNWIIALTLSLPLATLALPPDPEPPANVQNADYMSGRKAVAERNWQGAVEAFQRVVKTDPRNADAHSLLGYAYRHMNQMESSFKHYHEALRLNPGHRGAHNYIGWAYLKSNQLAKAEEHLGQLEKLCGQSCEEYQDLSKGVAEFKAKNRS